MAESALLDSVGSPAAEIGTGAARESRAPRLLPTVHQGIRAGLRGVRLLDWVARRSLYYLLPPFLHSALKNCAPRILQRPVQHQVMDRLRQRWHAWTAPPGTDPSSPPPIAAYVTGNVSATTAALPSAAPVISSPHFLASSHNFVVSEDALREAEAVLARYREVYAISERRLEELEHKCKAYVRLGQEIRIDRVRLFRELARLEQMRGNDLVACAYRVRGMRLLGADVYRDLVWVRRVLETKGFVHEAAALEAMYGVHGTHDDACLRILQTAFDRHRQAPALSEHAFIEDRRPAGSPKVSVIVSLYNAAAKLPCFLHALQSQTLLRSGQMELILVDSRSPANEYQALRQTQLAIDIPYVFVRSAERETIQTAWNRGIALARAPYLAFLGVDEGITPDALETLAGVLDSQPHIDWVQGNSIVTDVDRHGMHVRDVMMYDRTGYTQDHVYLETCYLSWVGALYRRSIHDRFGYYDGSFGAAGDTEFKSRILPFIQSRCLPKTLGVFFNYPEERTTASPRAELEDIRAWYLHRTPAGVRYAFQKRDPVEAEKLLLLALHYRKSYVQHTSTDIDYAAHVGAFLADELPQSPALALLPGIDSLLDALRSLDLIHSLDPHRFADALTRARLAAAKVQAEHRATPWLQHAHYGLFNDNRHEQHSFYW